MTQPQQPDNHEFKDETPVADHCALLDEYWDALRHESDSDLGRLIEREQPDESIAGDLEVLNLLHQVRRETRAAGEATDFPVAWLSDSSSKATASLARAATATPPARGEGPESLRQPERIGKYQVIEMLDRGGQAQVFRVIHPELVKDCVLKLARRPMAIDDQVGSDALRCEARLLVQCEHPNLVRVLDLDVHEGRWFFVMEYFPALTLEQFVARHQPGPRQAARLVIELSRAVTYLHARGITHQDIKPQNILVDDRGRPRLIDLGMARQNHAWRDDADDSTSGTAGYMSPEQANGTADLVGPRTDVFGLGSVLYHLLTGRPLYVASSRAATRRLAQEAEYNPIRQLKPQVPRSLERICRKALAAEPVQRYPTANAMERDLRRYLKTPLFAASGAAALFMLMAAVLFALSLGPRQSTSERATILASDSALAVPVPLTVVELGGSHYRKRETGGDVEFGQVELSTQPILENDGVSVMGKLGKPAYCYVIALTPDGKDQLYWPSDKTASPSLSVQIGTDKQGFRLTDGPGLQVFVVLASTKQLPPFKDWKGRGGLARHWTPVASDDFHGVWEYKDGTVKPISGASRGPVEKRGRSQLTPFRDVCDYLAKLPDFEAVRAFAFPVKPKIRLFADGNRKSAESPIKLAAELDAQGKGVAPRPKAPAPRFLQGEDAKRAADLDKTVEAAMKADHWDEAIARSEELLALKTRVQGPKHFETVYAEWAIQALRRVAAMPHEDRVAYHSAGTMNAQARDLYGQGKFALAQGLDEKAIEIRKRLLSDDYPETAESYNNLAYDLVAQAKYAAAQPLYEKALAIKQRLLTDDHPETVRGYNSLAYLFNMQGKYDLAEPLFDKALEIDRRILTEDHADTARCYNNVAANLDARGRYAQAQPLFQKALEINRRLLTDDHRNTATAYSNLASNLKAQGKYDLAQPLYQRALEISCRVLTEDHPDTARKYHNLAANLHAQRKYAEAQALFERALDISRRRLGDDNSQTASTYDAVANNLSSQRKYVLAEPYYKKALDIRTRLLTNDHPHTAASLDNLAVNLDSEGQYIQAQTLHETALDISSRLLSRDHTNVIIRYDNLAKNLDAQGKYREARDHWQTCVKSLDAARLQIAFAGLERAGNSRSPRAALAAVQARLGQPAVAWQTLEEDLGRGLLDEMAARQDGRLTAAERDRLGELTKALDRLDRLVESVPKELAQAKRAKQFEDLKHQRELASIALGEFQAALVRAHGSTEGRVAGRDEVQAALPADAAMVAWVDIPPPGPNAADRDGEHWGVVVRSRGVPSWIATAGTAPDGLWSQDDTRLASQVRTELRKRPDDGAAHLRQLIERLRTQRLEPLAKALGAVTDEGLPAARTLIVLPSHDMAGIPVEALLASDDTRTVSYAPSGTVLKSLRERSRPDPHAGLLAVGDPVYLRPDKSSDPEPPDHGLLVSSVAPGSDAAERGLKRGDVLLSYNGTKLLKRDDLKVVPESGKPVRVEFWRGGKVDAVDLTFGKLDVVVASEPAPLALAEERKMQRVLRAARSGSEVFDRLPWTRDEVEAMDKLFRSDDRPPARILLGADASEAELERLANSGQLACFGVIHLATHAVIDENVPARSAAILTQTGLPDPLDQALNKEPVFDGRLSVREIQRGWELNAELVTLSACETALGRDSGGEGFVGFTQALLISGARSVLLSLWKVDDRATSLLMTRFYQNWLGKRPGLEKRLSKAEALREAKHWLRGLSYKEVTLELDRIPRGVEERAKPNGAARQVAHPYEHPYFWAGFILTGDPS